MQSSYWGGATSPASKAVLCEQSGSFQVSGCGRTSTPPSKCPWSPFYGVTSQRWPNWEWLDSKKPARSFLHGHLLCSRLCFPCHLCMQQMLPAACCLGCSVSSEKPNQRPQVGSVCFCPERSTSLYFTPVCSLTHFTSACVHQALLGKKPLGNTGLYHWKGSEIQLWKHLSFLFIFLAASFIFIFNMAKSFYRNHSVTGKGERGVRLKCNPSRWMLPSQMLFPFLPILFSFDIAGRLFS